MRERTTCTAQPTGTLAPTTARVWQPRPEKNDHRSGGRHRAAGRRSVIGILAGVSALVAAIPTAAATGPFIDPFNSVQTIAPTVPKHGDVNPYGVAVVPVSRANLVAGDVLVSNFNNHRNLQGTGSTIVEVSPGGGSTLFASLAPNKLPGPCPGGLGLTTALVALRSGWVIVGSLPTKDGTSASMQAGCLLVVDPSDTVVETISGPPINGPWDMTAVDAGTTATLFVSNVLNGTVAASPKPLDRALPWHSDARSAGHGGSCGRFYSISAVSQVGPTLWRVSWLAFRQG